jgi:gliding motility-associated-like protein
LGCAGNLNGTITLTGSGGSGPISYSIDTINYQAGGSFTGLAAGTYTVGIQDSAGCKLLGSTLTINEPTMVVIDSEIMVDISCAGASDGTITIVASGGTGSYFYSIDGGTTLVNTTGVFSGLSPGSYDVFLIDTDTCVAQGSTFTLTDPPSISITSETKTDIDCLGDADGTIDIVATGGTAPLSYSIDTIDFTNTTGSFTNLDSGTYYIAVQDANGCTQMGSILIITAPATAITLSDSVVDVTGCNGNSNGAIYLSGAGGTGSLVYSIDGGTTFDNGTGIFTNLAGGSYDLAAQDDNGCTLLGATVTISQPPLLTISAQSASDPTKGNCDGEITIIASGGTPGYTYLWDDTANQTDSTAANLCGGAYMVLVTDANGCTSTLTITLVSPDNDLFIPTAFSPNGDNENDKFLVRGSYTSITMVVYNRWGEKVFETKVKDQGWDGTQNGTNAPSDSYGYYIELVMTDGSTQIFKGDILLVR